jgi:hypothetical protein
MKRIEIEVKRWHHDPPQYPDLKANLNKRALGASCRKPDNDSQCKDNEVENSQGKCESCKQGMRPQVHRVPQVHQLPPGCMLTSCHLRRETRLNSQEVYSGQVYRRTGPQQAKEQPIRVVSERYEA